MKQNVKRYVGKVLILLGLLLLLIIGAIHSYTCYKEKEKIQTFLNNREMYQQSLETEENLKAEENLETEDNLKAEENLETSRNLHEEDGVIGILYIDRINLRVAIAEGTDKEALRYSVGHFTDTAMPGESGNACFTGHRSYAFGEYFNRLDEVQVGDRIKILTLDQTLEYEVTESFVVEPEETWVLDPTEEETITLITCTPVRIATHRLIIRAKRV